MLKELGDGGSGAGFEVGIEVKEGPAGAGCEKASYGRFAGSHETGEDEASEMHREGGALERVKGCGCGRHGSLLV